MKRTLISAVNNALKPAGVEVVRSRETTDFVSTYTENQVVEGMLADQIEEIAQPFFDSKPFGEGVASPDLRACTADALRYFSLRPGGANRGGSGFHNTFWLHTLAKAFDPQIIVESGVWKGASTWLFEQTCPDAKIFAFDIDLGYVDRSLFNNVEFHQYDWSEHEFVNRFEPEATLGFFDCHVDHAKRIIECSERGLRHALFDDNCPMHRVLMWQLLDLPPCEPTVDLLLNLERFEKGWEKLAGTTQFSGFEVDLDMLRHAASLIEDVHAVPDLGAPTNLEGASPLTYVRIKVDQ